MTLRSQREPGAACTLLGLGLLLMQPHPTSTHLHGEWLPPRFHPADALMPLSCAMASGPRSAGGQQDAVNSLAPQDQTLGLSFT